MRMTTTTRTLAYLEARGWIAGDAERRQGPITRDLFGCFDIVAVHPLLRQVLFVQVTSASNFASRMAKVKAQPTTEGLLLAGVGVEVWGWSDKAEPRIERIEIGGKREGER